MHIHHTNFLLLVSSHFFGDIFQVIYCHGSLLLRITSPLLLIALGGSLGACHVVSKRNSEKKLILLGREMNLIEQYGLIALISFPLFYLAGAGAAVLLGRAQEGSG